MMLKEIRTDLTEIRYYYAHKKVFDEAICITGSNIIMDKVQRYNEAVSQAPLRQYEIYVGLYINNNTQEWLAEELGYTPEYIQMLNKQLLLYLQKTL